MTDRIRSLQMNDDNRRWWALGAMCFALFMIMLDNTVVNVALPSIQRSLHASTPSLEWTVNAYTLSFAVLLVTAHAAHGLALDRGSQLEHGLPDLDAVADLEAETDEDRGVDRCTESAAPVLERCGQVLRRGQSNLAVERVGGVDRLELDQAAPIAVERAALVSAPHALAEAVHREGKQ